MKHQKRKPAGRRNSNRQVLAIERRLHKFEGRLLKLFKSMEAKGLSVPGRLRERADQLQTVLSELTRGADLKSVAHLAQLVLGVVAQLDDIRTELWAPVDLLDIDSDDVSIARAISAELISHKAQLTRLLVELMELRLQILEYCDADDLKKGKRTALQRAINAIEITLLPKAGSYRMDVEIAIQTLTLIQDGYDPRPHLGIPQRGGPLSGPHSKLFSKEREAAAWARYYYKLQQIEPRKQLGRHIEDSLMPAAGQKSGVIRAGIQSIGGSLIHSESNESPEALRDDVVLNRLIRQAWES